MKSNPVALVGRLRATDPVFSFRTRSDRPVRGRVDGFGKTVHHERGSEVTFTNAAMCRLMATPQVAPQESAEQANLCLEERISPSRRAVYEGKVGTLGDWRNWRGDHLRYVQNEVRRRNPLSAAFSAGEPSLRPGIEPNQYLYRVERIDRLLRTFDTSTGGHVEAADVNDWISVQRSVESSNDTIFGSAHPGGAYVDPRIDALQELTDLLNEERSDGRPSFVSFETENPAPHRPGWAEHFCERYGLAHFFTNSTVTLALFRYRVQEVLDGRTDAGTGATLFAVPTVIDQPMDPAYFTAPRGMDWGHAVCLNPAIDCSHLAAELIHARIDYHPRHWVSVGTLNRNCLSAVEIVTLREKHLDCIRRSPGLANYGTGCI